MDGFGFLKKFVRLQQSVTFFDEVIDILGTLLAFSKDDPSTFSNYALVNKNLEQRELELIESEFLSRNRISTIYFETLEKLETLKNWLIEQGYEKSYEDSWMFHNGENIDKSRFETVKKVKSPEELEVFLKVFDESFQVDDPQNPYGDVKVYIEKVKKIWFLYHESGEIEYFTIFKNSIPVAISAITNFEDIGYISNVGSLRSVRGEGFGKLATLYVVARSKELGNKYHCLATEEGQYPNEFYKRIGFETKFKAIAFAKSNKKD